MKIWLVYRVFHVEDQHSVQFRVSGDLASKEAAARLKPGDEVYLKARVAELTTAGGYIDSPELGSDAERHFVRTSIILDNADISIELADDCELEEKEKIASVQYSGDGEEIIVKFRDGKIRRIPAYELYNQLS